MERYSIEQLRGAFGAGAATNRDGLSGKYFHVLVDGKINQQGLVESSIGNGKYNATFFSWIDGLENGTKIVSISDMGEWVFYTNSDAMKHAYEKGVGGNDG